jgi:putative transposase
MPNHIHFLVKIKSLAEIEESFKYYSETSKVSKNLGGLSLDKRISQQFSNLFNSYTKAFNKMHARSGSLFAPNFKRKEISNAEYFKNVILYIHQNPIHHGFTNRLTDWAWTSFQVMLVDLPTELKRKEVLNLFGNSSDYLRFHSRPIPKEVLSEIGK